MNNNNFQISERENIEWINCWWSQANRKSRRCLLVGDSTIRQIRGSLELLASNLFAVDIFASSLSIFDVLFWKNLRLFFRQKEYKYDLIIVQYGGHHGFCKRCSEHRENYFLYYNNYQKMIRFLKKQGEKIILLSSTSEVYDGELDRIDEKIEKEIEARNMIAKEVSRKNKCFYFDLNNLMKNSIYAYRDRQHFERVADGYMAYHIMQFVEQMEIIDKSLIEQACEKNREFISQFVSLDKKIDVYGAGEKGAEIYWFLRWNGLVQLIDKFVESKTCGSQNVLQIPIVEIKQGNKVNSIIISSNQYKTQMEENARKNGYSEIIFFGDVKSLLVEKMVII